MPILSHLHHLFHTDTCQACIHALRWKDCPLYCPQCHSRAVGPWGGGFRKHNRVEKAPGTPGPSPP